MTSIRYVAARLLTMLALAICLGGQAAAQTGRTYFVDFEHGSNGADGLSRQSPWKHAPGDPAATGAPARVRIGPGDVVRFRGGTVYRGSLTLRVAGTPSAPVRYSGQGWGDGRAVLSGRDPIAIELRRCADDPTCRGLGTADDDLMVADLPPGVEPTSQFVVDGRVLNLAQAPTLADPFFSDDISSYLSVSGATVSASDGGWRLAHPRLAALAAQGGAQDMFLYLWGVPNLVYEARVRSLDPGGVVLVEAPRFRPYADRDTRFAIANHPAAIRNPGDFATAKGGGLLIVKLPGGPRRAALEVGRRPFAIDASQARHVAIEGFAIEGYVGGASEQKGGVALWLSGRAAEVAFRDNHVRDLGSRAGSGAVQAVAVEGLKVERNRFERLRQGSGIRTGQGAKGVEIIGNAIRRVGRTGVGVIASRDVSVRDNRISEIRGVHGNAISVYLATREVVVANNLITDATRAITFHGAGGAPNDIAIRSNLIAVSGPGSVGIQSWGKGANGVELTGNVVFSPSNRVAMHLDPGDRRVTVSGNLLDSFYVQGQLPADWRVTGNVLARPAPANFRGAAALPADNQIDPKPMAQMRDASFSDIPALCRALAAVKASMAGPGDLCR